ncbi:MAG TPA: hypothetical protein PKG77_22295 [Phycisphaerae bacterium]|nr:hypothetical protein [Phycisphaerae bacterium]HQL76407.1 hypothetical protein [Phycisphaerae bacterium]
MSVKLEYTTNLTATEVLETNTVSSAAASRTVKHTLLNKAVTLDGTTTPPVTKVAAFEQALTAGAATIDLTALVGTNGAVVNGTGLKVQAIKITAKATNANAITITKGASNGYALAGAGFSVALAAGQEFVFYGNSATPAIASDAKTLDLAGTLTQAVQVVIVMG